MPEEESVDFAEQKAELDRKAAAIKAREKELNQREYEDFAEGLIQAGQLPPAEKANVVALMSALPADQSLDFAEGDDTVKKPALDGFKSLLSRLPKQIDFAERAGHEGDGETTVDFSAPQGYTVDTAQAELHRKAKAYQQQHPDVDFATAVAAVS